MKTIIISILMMTPAFAQAGWTLVDGRYFWIPAAGEPQTPPMIPSQGQANSSPHLNLPPPPLGWQYDPKYNPIPPGGPSSSMTEAQAKGVANAANGVISMIGNHPPSQAEIECQKKDSELEKQKQEKAQLEEKTRQMIEEAKKTSKDALPPTEKSVRKSFAEMAADQKVRLSIHLDTIPDPDESQLPYQLRASEEQFRNELMRTYKDLYKIDPKGRKQQRSKEIGLLGVREADQSFTEGDNEQAQFWKSLAEEALEVAIGLNPTTGFIQSMYELVTGKSFVTSDDLNTTQRAFAFLGVVTLGGAKSITVAGSVMNKVYRGAAGLLRERAALEIAVREGELLVQKAGNLIEGWQKKHLIIDIVHTTEANSGFVSKGWLPPFLENSWVIKFKTIGETKWMRVHTGREQGSFLLKESQIIGLSPAQIQQKFALPEIPTYIQNVTVPHGTQMWKGAVEPHSWGGRFEFGPEGAVQWHLTELIPIENFGPSRILPEVFK